MVPNRPKLFLALMATLAAVLPGSAVLCAQDARSAAPGSQSDVESSAGGARDDRATQHAGLRRDDGSAVQSAPYVLSGAAVPDVLHLYPNESKIIKVEGLKRVSITNQDIADVVIVSPDEILVLPNRSGAGGRTSAYFWDKDGRKEIKIIVIGRIEEGAIADQIQKDINLPTVRVEFINNRIILRGKVRNQSEKQYATDIAGLYGSAILNLLEIEGLALDPKEALVKLINLPDVKITVVDTALQATTAQLGQTDASGRSGGGAQTVEAGASAPVAGSVPLYVSASGASSPAGGAGGAQAAQAQARAEPAGGTAAALGAPVPQGELPRSVMVLLEGTVDDEQDKARAEEIARAFFGIDFGAGFRQAAVVINHIEVVRPLQVLVEGLLLELRVTDQDRLDFRWGSNPQHTSLAPGSVLPSLGAAPLPDQNFSNIKFFETPVGQTLGDYVYTGADQNESFWPPFPFGLQRFNRADPLLLQVEWALNTARAKLISSPKIVARSGQTATIDVGGTDPVQTAAGLGATGVQLIRSGTTMEITPRVDHRGNIDTDVRISVVDSQGGGNTNNRSTSTRVTVRDGEHIVVSGLMEESEVTQVTKLPFFGDLPWIGRLFRTKNKQMVNKETIAIVTPRLLDAVKKEQQFAGYGQTGPSERDTRSMNKGKGAGRGYVPRPGVPSNGAAAQESASSRAVAESALARARVESAQRGARIESGSLASMPVVEADDETRKIQTRVRELFRNLKTGEEPEQPAVRRFAPPVRQAVRRMPEIDEGVDSPLAGSVRRAPAGAPAMTGNAVATMGLTPQAGEAGPVPSPAATASIDHVTARIDALFDKLDRDLAGKAN